MSKGWLVAGTLATVGGFWLAVGFFRYAALDNGAMPYLAHVLGAAATGAVMLRHAPLRPWREPLIAGVFGVGILSIPLLALPHPEFSWVAARSAHPWSTAVVIALLSGGSSLGGAALIRKIAPAAQSGTASLLVLSGLVTCGAVVTISQMGMGLGLTRNAVAIPNLVATFAGGFLTQTLVSTRRPWVCGGGMLLFILPLVVRTLDTPAHVATALCGALLFAAFGAWGARRAWRRKERNGTIVELELPSARIES